MKNKVHGKLEVKMSGRRFCKLCGEPFPLEGIEQADSCAQWCNYIARNMPGPGNVGDILSLSLICRLCMLQTALNRALKAAEYFTDTQDMFPVESVEEK